MDLGGGDSPQGDDDILLGALDSELAGLRMEGEGREESELFLNQLLDSSGEVYTILVLLDFFSSLLSLSLTPSQPPRPPVVSQQSGMPPSRPPRPLQGRRWTSGACQPPQERGGSPWAKSRLHLATRTSCPPACSACSKEPAEGRTRPRTPRPRTRPSGSSCLQTWTPWQTLTQWARQGAGRGAVRLAVHSLDPILEHDQ